VVGSHDVSLKALDEVFLVLEIYIAVGAQKSALAGALGSVAKTAIVCVTTFQRTQNTRRLVSEKRSSVSKVVGGHDAGYGADVLTRLDRKGPP
jgi:hypothetical protein